MTHDSPADTTVEEQYPAEVVRWYTKVRKFPQLLGKTPGGQAIPGGPYTLTQAILGLVVFLLGAKTMWLWGGADSALGNVIVLCGFTVAVVWGTGQVPMGTRNPLLVVAGVTRAVRAPRLGRLAGREVKLDRPRPARGRVQLVDHHDAARHAPRQERPPANPAPQQVEAGRDGVEDPATPPAPAWPVAGPALSGVQQLLANAARTEEVRL